MVWCLPNGIDCSNDLMSFTCFRRSCSVFKNNNKVNRIIRSFIIVIVVVVIVVIVVVVFDIIIIIIVVVVTVIIIIIIKFQTS